MGYYTGAKQAAPVPEPTWKRIPASPETRTGKCEPYRYAIRCKKCGGELVEGQVWEGLKWNVDGTSKTILVCHGCRTSGGRSKSSGRSSGR